VLIDARNVPCELTPTQIAHIAHRRYGVGCDQILLIEPSNLPDACGRYRIFNADGSSAEHCGNGVRCVAKFLRDTGAVRDGVCQIEIDGRTYALTLLADDQVRVDMGIPSFVPADLPFVAAEAQSYRLEFQGSTYTFGAVSVGNPHAVFEVADVATAPVAELGALLQEHPWFPRRVNVGFMQIVSPAQIRLRVFERGAGETTACGTGACAAVAVGVRWGKLAARTTVALRGGDLIIEWGGEHETLYMTGPATTVFEGTITL
jgi:diaminopimelate epimerase